MSLSDAETTFVVVTKACSASQHTRLATNYNLRQGSLLRRSVNVPEKLVTILKERFPEPAQQPLLVHLSTDNVQPIGKPVPNIVQGRLLCLSYHQICLSPPNDTTRF